MRQTPWPLKVKYAILKPVRSSMQQKIGQMSQQHVTLLMDMVFNIVPAASTCTQELPSDSCYIIHQ